MENFEEYLMEKYPDLFYKKEDGSLDCPCGVSAPDGWHTIIDNLCGAITSYTKNSFHTKRVVINNKYYFWKGCSDFLNWGYKYFIKFFPKYNKWEYKKSFFAFVEKFRQQYYKCVKYNKVYPPEVKIDQIKSKLSDLRFYYSGGNKEVAGMVSFAEYLCSKTCENTGEPGIKCINGGWYATLSPKEVERLRYSTIE